MTTSADAARRGRLRSSAIVSGRTISTATAIVGRTITLDRLPFQIAGVTPSWFTGLDKDSKYDVAVPIACEPLFHADGSALDERSWWWLRIVARLRTGVTVQRTESEIAGLTPGLLRASMAPE